jgi:hypothetical protein
VIVEVQSMLASLIWDSEVAVVQVMHQQAQHQV